VPSFALPAYEAPGFDRSNPDSHATRAGEGEYCNVYNPVEKANFPSCEPWLHCTRAPGHNKPTCHTHHYYKDLPLLKVDRQNNFVDETEPVLSVLTPVGLGETCEGFNEATGLPYPSCASGLKCGDKSATRTSLPGAERKCIDPHAMMPNTDEAPHEAFDPKKYPFLSIEFPFEAPEHVVTDHAEEHYYAEPKECKPCEDLKE
jgi:hypothetical protein